MPRKNKSVSWLKQKLAWLAAFFGITIALLAAVTYKSLVGVNPQIMEQAPGTVEKKWEFESASEVGPTAWQGFVSWKNTSYQCVKDGPTYNDKKKCDDLDGKIIATYSKGQKLPLELSVADGWVRVGPSTGLIASSAYLINNNINLDVDSGWNKVAVEVVMKGEFGALGGRTITQNMAGLTLMVQGRLIGNIEQRASANLGEDGEATYVFSFDLGKIKPRKIIGVTFQPTTVGAYWIKNARIDSITILSQ